MGDAYLRTPGPINDTCTLIEEKTKVQRKYIGLGVGIITMGLVFSTLAPLVVNLIAFIYPAYKSIKALESNDKDDDSKWLTYWVVYGFFSCMEFFRLNFELVPLLLHCQDLPFCVVHGPDQVKWLAVYLQPHFAV